MDDRSTNLFILFTRSDNFHRHMSMTTIVSFPNTLNTAAYVRSPKSSTIVLSRLCGSSTRFRPRDP